jgi:transcriptional regulator with XRE-family HTH domain
MAARGILRALGDEIRQCRQARGLSQEELAETAGLHRNFIGLIERGQRNATILTLESLAHALRISLTDLITKAEKRSK